jgi:hypothetical protein
MKKLLSVGLALLLVFGTAATALAQRDAGAKARGEFGTGFWNSRRTDRGAYYYRPVQPTQSYQVFSFEPLGIHPGDAVMVTGSGTKLMSGRNVVANVEKGREFKVTRIVKGWLGAELTQDGKTLKGWIWHKNVGLVDHAPGERVTPRG